MALPSFADVHSPSTPPPDAEPLHGVLAPDRGEVAHDTALAERVRQGEVDALGALFDRYAAALQRFVIPYVGDRQSAEDVVQDVFVRVWESRTRWTVTSSVAQYLFGAARNRALQLQQREAATLRREARVAQATAGKASDEVGTTRLEADELRRHLARAVDALPPRCRDVFLLSRVRRLSQREIAETLGIALPTVKVQLGRALRALERALADYEMAPRNTSAPSARSSE